MQVEAQPQSELTITRQCGGCTVCCTYLEVPQLRKPQYTHCQHCTVGQGCRIWQERPQVCRTYNCFWLQGKLPEAMRPDRCGLVFDRMAGTRMVACLFHPAAPQAVLHPAAQGLIKQLLAQGNIVAITRASRAPGTRWLRPPGMTQQQLDQEIAQAAKRIKQWQRLHTPAT